jgi:hypothetical protein
MTGIGRVDWYGDRIVGLVHDHAAEVLGDAGEFLLEEANQTVPIEEGNLARSGSVDVDRGELAATVSYDTPYAVRLHENPQYHFQHGRRGKWLQLTLPEQRARIERFLRDRMEGAFR